MAKFKTGLVKGYREKQNQEQVNEKRQKVKKVTKMAYKISINPIVTAIRTAAIIAILILATVGLLALLHPETRNTIIEILNAYFLQIKSMLGF